MTAKDDGEIQAIGRAVVDALVERGLVVYAAPSPSARVLNVSEVALLLGRSAAWVYEHSAELGAIRMGSGPRARIGFDLMTLEQWKRERQVGPPEARRPRRSSGQSGTAGGQSLIAYEPLQRRA